MRVLPPLIYFASLGVLFRLRKEECSMLVGRLHFGYCSVRRHQQVNEQDRQTRPKEFCWVGTEAQKFSFPDGMSTAPLVWRFLDMAIPMQVWSGSTCACASADGSEVAPAVCVGFTINSPSPEP